MSSFHYLLSTSIVSDVSPPGISSQQGTAAGPHSQGMNTQHTEGKRQRSLDRNPGLRHVSNVDVKDTIYYGQT